MSLRVLELAAAADVIGIPGPISTGGPIARAPEAVGYAGVPCTGRVGVRRRCRFWHLCHIDVFSTGGRCTGAIRRWRVHGCQGRRSYRIAVSE